MRILFRCGHDPQPLSEKAASPACLRCGETRVARVLGVPAPRIVGHGSGPLVQSKALEAIPVSLAPKGPLKLKADADAERTH